MVFYAIITISNRKVFIDMKKIRIEFNSNEYCLYYNGKLIICSEDFDIVYNKKLELEIENDSKKSKMGEIW